MPIFRPNVKASNSVATVLKNGWGMLESYSPTNTGVGATTLTAAIIQGGLVICALTGAANLTLDTGANLDAAFPDADVGDEWNFQISNPTAFVATVVTATGITLSGVVAIPAGACKQLRLVRTGTGTWNCQIL